MTHDLSCFACTVGTSIPTPLALDVAVTPRRGGGPWGGRADRCRRDRVPLRLYTRAVRATPRPYTSRVRRVGSSNEHSHRKSECICVLPVRSAACCTAHCAVRRADGRGRDRVRAWAPEARLESRYRMGDGAARVGSGPAGRPRPRGPPVRRVRRVARPRAGRSSSLRQVNCLASARRVVHHHRARELLHVVCVELARARARLTSSRLAWQRVQLYVSCACRPTCTCTMYTAEPARRTFPTRTAPHVGRPLRCGVLSGPT